MGADASGLTHEAGDDIRYFVGLCCCCLAIDFHLICFGWCLSWLLAMWGIRDEENSVYIGGDLYTPTFSLPFFFW